MECSSSAYPSENDDKYGQRVALLESMVGEARPELEGILVVREYPDVYVDNITELPLERDVEFSIDLLLGDWTYFHSAILNGPP